MLGRQPESRTFDPRQPLVREGAADYVLLQNGQRASAAAAGGRHLPADEPREAVLQEQVLAARSTHPSGHKGNAAGRQKRGPGLRVQGLAPRKCPGWRGQPAARQAVGAANTAKRQAGDAAADNRRGRGPRRRQGAHHGTQRRDVLLRPGGEVGGVLGDDAIPEQPRTRRNHPAAEAARPAPRVVPTAVLQQYPGMRIRGFRGQRLRAAAAGSTPWHALRGGLRRLRRPCRARLARARHLAGGDTSLLRVAQRAHISNTGEPLDRFEPAQRETKTVVFTYYDGHAFFYRNARPVLEQMGCTGATRSRPCRHWRSGARGRARSSRATSTRRTYGRRGGSCCSRSTTRRPRSARSRSSRA